MAPGHPADGSVSVTAKNDNDSAFLLKTYSWTLHDAALPAKVRTCLKTRRGHGVTALTPLCQVRRKDDIKSANKADLVRYRPCRAQCFL